MNRSKQFERVARLRWPENDIAAETFEQAEPKGWSIAGGARLVPEGAGRILRVMGTDRAAWHEHHIADGRLNFRYRCRGGAGVVLFRESIGAAGEQAYELRLRSKSVQLVRRVGGEMSELAAADYPLEHNEWHDIGIWMAGPHTRISMGGRFFMNGYDPEPLPPGRFAFGGEEAEAADFADFRLIRLPPDFELPGESEEEPLDPRRFLEQPEELWQPDTWPGPIQLPQIVSLEVKPDFDRKRPAPINAGSIPPVYLHSWGIDVTGLTQFRLYLRSQDDVKLDFPDDFLKVVDETGTELQSFKSMTDLDQNSVTLPASSASSSQRIYLILETSKKDMERHFRMVGFLNSTPNTGAEEALLVGDDLSYEDWKGRFFEALDTNGNPFPVYWPWLPGGPHTFREAWDEPKRDEGWYLVGKNITSGEGQGQGFFSLIYYNERTSLLRVFLLNLSLPETVTGYTVELLLLARDGKGFVPLEGAFFTADPRPPRWSRAAVTMDMWPRKTWISIDVPMLYPMAKELPSKEWSPVSNLPEDWYSSLYEDASEKGLRNIRLSIQIQPFTKGTLKGDVIGQAVGEAVQEVESSSGISIKQFVDFAGEAISKGKDWSEAGEKLHKKAAEYLKNLIKANDPHTGELEALVNGGASAWGGALAAAGVGVAIFQSFFNDPDPLKLAIELAIKGKLKGSVYTPMQQVRHDYYLPGRCSILEVLAEAGGDPTFINAVLPRYDHTMGHFGFRYDPAKVEFRTVRTDYFFEDDPYIEWPWGRYVYPAVAKPRRVDLAAPNAVAQLDQWLPIIFNPYAEIVPIKPDVKDFQKFANATEIPKHEPWYRWIQDVSMKNNVTPDQDDTTFPHNVTLHGDGPRLQVTVFSENPSKSIQFIGESTMGRSYLEIELKKGVWLDIYPETSFVPLTYRAYSPATELKNLRTHTWWSNSYSLEDAEGEVKIAFLFPLHDVMFYWDIPYYYYARTRKANSQVPRSLEVAKFCIPVTVDLHFHPFDYSGYDENWFFALGGKHKSVLLMEPTE